MKPWRSLRGIGLESVRSIEYGGREKGDYESSLVFLGEIDWGVVFVVGKRNYITI